MNTVSKSSTTLSHNLIFITGAYGFIGRYLATFLADKGHHVVGIGHGIWQDWEARASGVSHWLSSDIEINALRALQQGIGTPSMIYHLAGGSSVSKAIADPRKDFYRTVVSTVELLEWMRIYSPATRLVAISSAAVYGSGHDDLIAEDTKLSPYSIYGVHKHLMEEVCRFSAETYGLQVCIARLFSVLGPGLRKQMLWDICSRLSASPDVLLLTGNGDERRDWTDVRDVVRALDLISSTDMRVINIGTGIARTVRDIALQVAQNWGRDIVFSGKPKIGDPFSLVAQPDKLMTLGFKWAISIEQSISDYVAWFKERDK